MKKLTLALDELVVASFETERPAADRGTVAAHGLSGITCYNCQTVLAGCATVPTRDGTCCTPIA